MYFHIFRFFCTSIWSNAPHQMYINQKKKKTQQHLLHQQLSLRK